MILVYFHISQWFPPRFCLLDKLCSLYFGFNSTSERAIPCSRTSHSLFTAYRDMLQCCYIANYIFPVWHYKIDVIFIVAAQDYPCPFLLEECVHGVHVILYQKFKKHVAYLITCSASMTPQKLSRNYPLLVQFCISLPSTQSAIASFFLKEILSLAISVARCQCVVFHLTSRLVRYITAGFVLYDHGHMSL